MRGCVWHWPGATVLALEEEEDDDEEDEEADWFSFLLWDAPDDGPGSSRPPLWTEHTSLQTSCAVQYWRNTRKYIKCTHSFDIPALVLGRSLAVASVPAVALTSTLSPVRPLSLSPVPPFHFRLFWPQSKNPHLFLSFTCGYLIQHVYLLAKLATCVR